MRRVVQIPYKPRPQQKVVAQRIRDGARMTVLVCHRRFGKCLDDETVIPTPGGLVPLKAIREGDEVYAPDGTPTRVVGVYVPETRGRCYELTWSDGTRVVCDADHRWVTTTRADRRARDRRGGTRAASGQRTGVVRVRPGRVRTTAELVATLTDRGEANHAVAVAAPMQGVAQALPVDPYLLGVWLGDGTRRTGEITTQEATVEAALAASPYQWRLVPPSQQRAGRARTWRGDRAWRQAIRALMGGGTGPKTIPVGYRIAPVADRQALVQGLFDTDGTISATTGAIEWTQRPGPLVDAVQEVLQGLGLVVRRSERVVRGRRYVRLHLMPPVTWCPFRVPAKVARWVAWRRRGGGRRAHRWRYLVAAREVPWRPMRCLQVAHPSRQFVCTAAHLPTHNTVLAVNLLLQAALQTPRPRPRCALVGPTYKQAKATAWDYLVYYSRPIPGIKVHNGELRVDYPNGGQVRLYGADNPDALRGIYLDAVVLDEYGLHPSETFTEVLAPTLVDRGGWAMFCGTPNGHNQFYQMAEQAKAKQAAGDPAWAYFEYKASETGLLDPGYLQQARLVMTEDEFQQEFECSFSASMRGSIYGKQLEEVERAGRITQVPYQPELPVETTWDLGVGDATAIWFTQRLRNGEVHVIDYYEASGEGLPHFIHVLQTKGYVYGKHFGPHDLAARELGTGKSRLEVAARLGVRFELVPDIGLEDGIQAARLLLQRTWFDATKCRDGLAALRAYRRQWDTRLGEFKAAPVHNWASHAADAFRYLAVWMTPPHVQQRRRLLWSPAMEAAYGWMA